MLTGKQLAKALSDAFRSGNWGDVDPHWFTLAANLNPTVTVDSLTPDDIAAMDVLALCNSVADRLNLGL